MGGRRIEVDAFRRRSELRFLKIGASLGPYSTESTDMTMESCDAEKGLHACSRDQTSGFSASYAYNAGEGAAQEGRMVEAGPTPTRFSASAAHAQRCCFSLEKCRAEGMQDMQSFFKKGESKSAMFLHTRALLCSHFRGR